MWPCKYVSISLWRLVSGIRISWQWPCTPNRARITLPEYRPKGKMQVTLAQILKSTESRLDELRLRRAALELEASSVANPPSFSGALRATNVGVIAEVKRRSPSAGAIR